ncbi:MAG: four helix bundle protein [bacterium]|nr:four helix bundle protein [bacterium]
MSRVRKSGGYRELRTFQCATLIYDATYWFCEKYCDKYSRMIDQMVQAARSGRQNIAEGSRAAATSSHTELRLVNVARASLEELLLDYEDFLRHRRQSLWGKDDPEARAVRRVASDHQSEWSDLTDQQRAMLYAGWLEHDDPFVRANALICLIHQTNYLLDQQIAALEKQFVEQGGYSELLAAKRLKHRSERSDQADGSSFPPCPQCGKPMVLRMAKTGQNAGKQFLGCSGYPDCKGVTNL